MWERHFKDAAGEESAEITDRCSSPLGTSEIWRLLRTSIIGGWGVFGANVEGRTFLDGNFKTVDDAIFGQFVGENL